MDQIVVIAAANRFSGSGEIGIHAGFRYQCRKAWGFKSPLPHQLFIEHPPLWGASDLIHKSNDCCEDNPCRFL